MRVSHRPHSNHIGGHVMHIHNQSRALLSHRHFPRRDRSSVLGKGNERSHDTADGQYHPVFDTNLRIPNWLPRSAHGHSSLPYASRLLVPRALHALYSTTTSLHRGDNGDAHQRYDVWATLPYQ